MINDLWYKNAIIYCLSVGTYMDANGDGIGDCQGLMRRLDYLHGLGVTAVWLMPFQKSPCRDDGYDVLGMGDDLRLPERNCARTPMQWSTEPHAGFTKSDRPLVPGYRWYRVGGLDYLLKRSDIDIEQQRPRARR